MFLFPSGQSSSYEIARSLRFNSTDSAYLNRTFDTPTNNTVWTFSCQIKRCKLSTQQSVFGAGQQSIQFLAGDTLSIFSAGNLVATSASVCRDPASHGHLVINSNGTYVKCYFNNTEVLSYTGTLTSINSAIVHFIGRYGNAATDYLDAYLSKTYFIDGQALDPSSFGYTDPNTHQWKPKAYTGSYGTNDFYLDFSDNTSTTTLGYDRSGNGNHWTLNNFSVAEGVNNDSLLDTPTNNFATLNAIYTGKSTLSNGNLCASGTTDLPTIIPDSGTWYFEVGGVSKTWTPPAAFPAAAGNYNFGQRPFANTATHPTLCTKNLPTPTGAAAKPWEHFDIKTRAGTGAVKTVTGIPFQPDLVWSKNRSLAESHHALFDSVRGAKKGLSSSSIITELTSNAGNDFESFNTDGYSLGATMQNWYVNSSGHAYVDWLFRAGGSAVTNTDGSITSQVSANTAAGFSIVTYTGRGANATVGHGLGVAPKMVIVKGRGNGYDWFVGHYNLGGWNNCVRMNQTTVVENNTVVWNSTAPTSNVFSLGNSDGVNQSTKGFIAYCFAEVLGYSKIGSYTGNNSADGPFVYCGFRPRWILRKGINIAGVNWGIIDTSRNSYNVANSIVCANTADAEATLGDIDITSNGFKMRSSSLNASGETYIYLAIAESPFKYSNAR